MIYKKALIINFGGIGDLVIFTAFFRNFKNSFPGCHVTALISSRGAELLKGLHYIDEIIAYDLQDVNFKDLIFSPQKFLKSIELLLKLRKRRYDISVNLLPLHINNINMKGTHPEFRQTIENARLNDIVIPIVKTSEEAAKDFTSPIEFILVIIKHLTPFIMV